MNPSPWVTSAPLGYDKLCVITEANWSEVSYLLEHAPAHYILALTIADAMTLQLAKGIRSGLRQVSAGRIDDHRLGLGTSNLPQQQGPPPPAPQGPSGFNMAQFGFG